MLIKKVMNIPINNGNNVSEKSAKNIGNDDCTYMLTSILCKTKIVEKIELKTPRYKQKNLKNTKIFTFLFKKLNSFNIDTVIIFSTIFATTFTSTIPFLCKNINSLKPLKNITDKPNKLFFLLSNLL